MDGNRQCLDTRLQANHIAIQAGCNQDFNATSGASGMRKADSDDCAGSQLSDTTEDAENGCTATAWHTQQTGDGKEHNNKARSRQSSRGYLPIQRDRTSITVSRAALFSGVLYSFSSAALTLLNKKVLVHYDFTAVHALLCFHCALAVALVRICSIMGWAEVEPLSWELVRIWMPVNLIFVGMLATNLYSLQLVGVGMVSVLKNLSNLLIICGDYVFFQRTYTWHVWVCLLLMLASVFMGGVTDINFTWAGYSWQMVNNVFTAGYALYLSRVTERVSSHTHDHKPLNQLSMVYYNNMLSLPLTILMVVARGEFIGFWQQQALYDASFQVLSVVSGVCGFLISFSSIWFVSLTTATFYSLVGSFNKVVVAAIGIWWFNESKEPRNLASIAAGLVAGSMLPFVKMRSAQCTWTGRGSH